MSADNFIGIFSSSDSLGRSSRWYTAEGMMSNIEDPIREELWKQRIMDKESGFPTREAALVAAHDMAKNVDIFVYGVIELE